VNPLFYMVSYLNDNNLCRNICTCRVSGLAIELRIYLKIQLWSMFLESWRPKICESVYRTRPILVVLCVKAKMK